jgi:hypothetical protein
VHNRLKRIKAFFVSLSASLGVALLAANGSAAIASSLEEERIQSRLNWTPLKQVAKT